LAYFHGQLLSAADMRTEQSYFREKLKLHNRCLHGYGVVCGLEVDPCPTTSDAERTRLVELERRIRADLERALAEGVLEGEVAALNDRLDEVARRLRDLESVCGDAGVGPYVRVRPGLAIDCAGNELIVRRPMVVSVWSLLSDADRVVARRGASVYLSLCACTQPLDPTRPALPDECGLMPTTSYTKLRDAVKLRATTTPPDADDRCEPCCQCGCDECVLLARFDGVERGVLLADARVDNSVRRMLARYVHTRVSGVSWQHGAQYSRDESQAILQHGIEIQFTRKVRAQTIARGVLTVFVIDGGQGRHGNMWNLTGEYVDLPATGWVDRIRFRQTTGEVLQDGDQVVITLRGAFVLDACCQPLAGTHVGGKVPLLPEHAKNRKTGDADELCPRPAGFPGPWTSGSDVGGTTFESWFFIQQS
jgi:hypothetical protein